MTEVFDRVLDCVEAPVYPWCTPESVEELLHHLEELPARLPELPILIPKDDEPIPDAIVQTLGDFACPTCPSRSACQRDYPHRLQTSAGTASTYQIDPSAEDESLASFPGKNRCVCNSFGYLIADGPS